MPAAELAAEQAAGVVFWGCEVQGELVAVMGIQPVHELHLIRHAYVHPAFQRNGAGGALLDHLRRTTRGPMLVGTWAAAAWAIRFYERHGFRRVSDQAKDRLLRTFWTIPERQVETSVVLASPPLEEA